MNQEQKDIINKIAHLHSEIYAINTEIDRIGRRDWYREPWLEGRYSELMECIYEHNCEISFLEDQINADTAKLMAV